MADEMKSGMAEIAEKDRVKHPTGVNGKESATGGEEVKSDPKPRIAPIPGRPAGDTPKPIQAPVSAEPVSEGGEK